jgi:hypothetical protein
MAETRVRILTRRGWSLVAQQTLMQQSRVRMQPQPPSANNKACMFFGVLQLLDVELKATCYPHKSVKYV